MRRNSLYYFRCFIFVLSLTQVNAVVCTIYSHKCTEKLMKTWTKRGKPVHDFGWCADIFGFVCITFTAHKTRMACAGGQTHCVALTMAYTCHSNVEKKIVGETLSPFVLWKRRRHVHMWPKQWRRAEKRLSFCFSMQNYLMLCFRFVFFLWKKDLSNFLCHFCVFEFLSLFESRETT